MRLSSLTPKFYTSKALIQTCLEKAGFPIEHPLAMTNPLWVSDKWYPALSGQIVMQVYITPWLSEGKFWLCASFVSEGHDKLSTTIFTYSEQSSDQEIVNGANQWILEAEKAVQNTRMVYLHKDNPAPYYKFA